jgi:rubrerythrin
MHWNEEEEHLDNFSAFLDKSTGQVMFQQDNHIIGKAF